jgi:membrane associated rhomboid family serine protease
VRDDDRDADAAAETLKEPAIKAPWPALGLTLALIGLYALQSAGGDPDRAATRFAFSPAALDRGEWAGLVTAMFVHGNWPHVLGNALWGLAFGAPVARLFGKSIGAAAAFFNFFLICGVAGNLGFAALHPGVDTLVVGASGGVSGLMGAASRLMGERDRLAPFTSRRVLIMAAVFLGLNLVIGVVGLEVLSGNAPIAWEAHLAGYALGLLLIGPVAKLFGRGALTEA